MGLFDWLTGNKPAPAGVNRQSAAKLRAALMAVSDYRFDTSEIHKPLIEAAHEAGWGWRSVAFAKL